MGGMLGSVEPTPTNNADTSIEPNNNGTVIVPVTTAARPWMLPTPIALQTFSIASGIAGGLAGFLLASRVQNSLHVSTTQVMMATGLSILATFGAIFVIRTVEEWPAE
jgi:hypothetical protein